MHERPTNGMTTPLELTMGQAFEKERMSRLIETTSDVGALRTIASTLLEGWMTQKAATAWVMRQALDAPPRVDALQFTTQSPETVDGQAC